MNIRSHHVATFLMAGAVFLSSLAWFGYRSPDVYASCGTDAYISLMTPSANTVVNGTFSLQAGTSSTAIPAPTGVTFTLTAPTAMVIGNATMAISGPIVTWSYPWVTTAIPDGSYQMTAIAHYGPNPATDCSSAPVAFGVHNTIPGVMQTPTLVVSIAPNTWAGLPGQSAPFTVSGVYTNAAGTAHSLASADTAASFVWTTATGSVAPVNGPTTNLIAGPLPGTYALVVKVTVSGLTTRASAVIKVNSPTAAISGSSQTPSPSPSTPPPPATAVDAPPPIGVGGTTPLTAAEFQQLSLTPTVFRPVAPTNSAPVVSVPILGCLKEKIGANFAAISDGQTQPTNADRLNASTCFSGADKIPANIAPVAPLHLAEVPASSDIVKLASIKNATITNADSKKIAVLLLTGTSTPNSSVFLYFFSDPMVLRAETDSNGKYNYVLQNPLAPGKHEVYAVAAKDTTTFVRTQALPITVAAAASSGQNGSLVIESKLQPVQVGFIIASILMVFAAVMILFRMVRRKPVLAPATVSYVAPSITNPTPSASPTHQVGTVFMPSATNDSPLVQPPADKQPPTNG